MSDYFSNDERRREARIYRSGEIFVEVMSAEPGVDKPPEIVRCEVLDISATGVQLLTDDDMVEGAILTLVVILDDHGGSYRMAGEVMWTQSTRDGYLVGFALLDSDQTGIDDWKALLTNFLN